MFSQNNPANIKKLKNYDSDIKLNKLSILKALIFSAYVDFKTAYLIFLGVMAGFTASGFLIINLTTSGVSRSNMSSLNTGLMTAIITMTISVIVMTSNSELLKKFSFPYNRNTLIFTHIFIIFLSPVILLLTSCTFYLLESLISAIVSGMNPGLLYNWIITKETFLTGFMASYILIVCISSVSYCVSAYFYRYKIIVGSASGIFLFILINFEKFRIFLLNIANSIFFKPTPSMFFIKLLGISVISIILAFIPLKRMEVKK